MMFGSSKKNRKTRTNPNPNLQDTINNLKIPPLSTQYTRSSQAHDQTQVDACVAGSTSSILVESMAASASTTQDQMQNNTGEVLPRQQRRGWISSTVSIGQDQAFNKVRNFLSDNEVGMVGIYGMGGVGKTTLMKKIRNEFLEPSNFKVIWVAVSKLINVDYIQKVILKEMKLPFDKDEHPYQRAKQINEALGTMKIALLFDDIWEFLDLEELGILGGIDLDLSIFKIIFTSRSERVCSQMQPDREIKVECLGWDDSWGLFHRSVGRKTLESDHRIEWVAKDIAKECKGLPLALTVIGRAMTCKKHLQEWKHALTTLQKSSSKDLDTEKKLFSCLKLSYDALPDRGEKDCFLLCCTYPEDWGIYKDDLVQYWIGEGVLPLDESYEDALNRGYDIIGTLLAACLLEKDGDMGVKMHDIIRDMGLWFASEMKLTFFVSGGSQLTKAQINDKWREAHKIYVLKGDELPEQPLCLNLSSLTFTYHQSSRISNGFFESMCKIRFLHLASVHFLELPTAIGQLLELRYLGIQRTNLKTLPAEVGNLSKLEVLFLNENVGLTELPGTIEQLVELRRITVNPCPKPFLVGIRSLSKLEILECIGEPYMELLDWGYVDFIYGLKQFSHSLRHLRMWMWPITSADELLLALENMHKLSKLEIGSYPFKEFLVLTSLCLYSLEELTLTSSTKLEKVRVGPLNLHSLRKLVIFGCENLVYIFGLCNLLGLEELTIMECYAMKEVIKEDEEVREGYTCFTNLKVMTLKTLQQLEIIGDDSVLFPSITRFILWDCPNLKKLPQGLMNENKTLKDGEIYGAQEWWDRLLWQDDEFKSFLLPHFKEYGDIFWIPSTFQRIW